MRDSLPHCLAPPRKGYNAFALIYRPGAQTACEDLARAIAFVYQHEDELDVDGHGGYNTVLDMQHALGTWKDGVISGQWSGNREYLWAMDSVEWGGQGSQMVMALQRLVGAVADGIWGKETSTKLQDRLIAGGYFCGDAGADGYFGRCSVRALQQCLNDGRLA